MLPPPRPLPRVEDEKRNRKRHNQSAVTFSFKLCTSGELKFKRRQDGNYRVRSGVIDSPDQPVGLVTKIFFSGQKLATIFKI